MPAGRLPGMARAPRVRSRQPMVRITASPRSCLSPAGPEAVTVRSASRERTVVSVRQVMPSSSAWATPVVKGFSQSTCFPAFRHILQFS